MADSLLQEVREDIQREKIHSVFVKYSKILAILLCAVIFFAALYIWWEYHKKNEIYADSSAFMSAIVELQAQNPNLDKAILKLESVAARQSNYAVISKFYLASLYDGKQEYEKAINCYDSITNNKSLDNTFRDFATLLSINLKVRYNKIKPSVAIDLLSQYIKINPIYLYTAEILQASLYLQEQKFENVKDVLDKLLTDPDASYTIRQMAMLLSSNIGRDGMK